MIAEATYLRHEAAMNSPGRSPPSAESPQQAIQEALALHREGKLELAMQRYIAVLERDPKNLDALYYVAVLALQEGQIAEGIKVLLRALDFGPPQARLHNLLGQAYLRLNQDDDALASFDRAIACEPGFADAYGNRANVLADMGRLPEALAAFDQALALRPDNAEDLCNRASVQADLGRHDEALAGYQRAIALMPDLAPAHFNRADILLRLGRLHEALSSYDRAIALAPKFAAAHANRGLTLNALGRLDEAKASLGRAAALDPKFTEPLRDT
jgi:tetratricopeptide (TPR) repeat protein